MDGGHDWRWLKELRREQLSADTTYRIRKCLALAGQSRSSQLVAKYDHHRLRIDRFASDGRLDRETQLYHPQAQEGSGRDSHGTTARIFLCILASITAIIPCKRKSKT